MEMNKFEALANDKEFIAQLAAMESVEEITAAINARGVEITVDQMKESLDIFLARKDSAELSEDDLDNVSGGISIGAAIVCGILIWTVISIIVGALDGMAAAANK